MIDSEAQGYRGIYKVENINNVNIYIQVCILPVFVDCGTSFGSGQNEYWRAC